MFRQARRETIDPNEVVVAHICNEHSVGAIHRSVGAIH